MQNRTYFFISSLSSFFLQKDSADPSTIICYDPATGYLIDKIPAPTVADVNEALDRARLAQEKWAKTTFDQRRAVLNSLLAFVLEHQETICRVGARDTGKTSKWRGAQFRCEDITDLFFCTY